MCVCVRERARERDKREPSYMFLSYGAFIVCMKEEDLLSCMFVCMCPIVLLDYIFLCV